MMATKRVGVHKFYVFDGEGVPKGPMSRAEARRRVREWRAQGYTSRRGSILWKSNESLLRRDQRLIKTVKGSAFSGNVPELLPPRPFPLEERSDYDIMERTLRGQYGGAVLVDDTRYSKEVRTAWETLFLRAEGRITKESYIEVMHHWFTVAVELGYIDPEDKVWIKEHVLYRAG